MYSIRAIIFFNTVCAGLAHQQSKEWRKLFSIKVLLQSCVFLKDWSALTFHSFFLFFFVFFVLLLISKALLSAFLCSMAFRRLGSFNTFISEKKHSISEKYVTVVINNKDWNKCKWQRNHINRWMNSELVIMMWIIKLVRLFNVYV